MVFRFPSSTKICLTFFNRTEEDILWREELDKLVLKDGRYVFIIMVNVIRLEYFSLILLNLFCLGFLFHIYYRNLMIHGLD